MTKGEEYGIKIREKFEAVKKRKKENTAAAIFIAFVLMIYSRRMTGLFMVAVRLVTGINVLLRTFKYLTEEDYRG